MAKERPKPEPGKIIEKGWGYDIPDIKETGHENSDLGIDRLPEPDPEPDDPSNGDGDED